MQRNTPVEVFQVRADVPAYWRMLSLLWNAQDENWEPDFTDPGQAVTADTILAAGSPGTEPLEQTFTVEADLGFPWLPAAYPPQQIAVTDTTVRFNGSTGTATLDDVLDAGDLYQVTSARVQPTPEQLAAVDFPAPSACRKSPWRASRMRLPGSRRSRSSGRRAPTTTSYPHPDHLNDDSVFTYDTTSLHAGTRSRPPVPDGDQASFCQQFASAMAISCARWSPT